jgi:hypothetical protein
LDTDGKPKLWFESNYNDYFYDPDDLGETIRTEQRLQVIQSLLKAGAKFDKELVIRHPGHERPIGFIMTPLILACSCGFWQAACILLDAGADWDATAHDVWPNSEDLCSIDRFLDRFPGFEKLVQMVVDFGKHQGFTKALKRWQNANQIGGDDQSTDESGGQHTEDTTSDMASPQERFAKAYRNGDWPAVRELLDTESAIEINCNDAEGENAVYCLSGGDPEELRYILEQGANPDLLTAQGSCALFKAIIEDRLENMSLLLEFGANIELPDLHGCTPLLYAIYFGRHAMVQRLLSTGANADAVTHDGRGGVHIAIVEKDTEMFSLLVERGLSTTSTDHFGSAPLHLACDEGLQFEAEKLVRAAPEASERINDHSLIYGTPLYVAARQGFVSIVQKLLNAGAVIDKTGPGNMLGPALMAACAWGRREVVQLLLSRGASTEVEGSRFLSAAGTARAFRRPQIIKILEDHDDAMRETEQMMNILSEP